MKYTSYSTPEDPLKKLHPIVELPVQDLWSSLTEALLGETTGP